MASDKPSVAVLVAEFGDPNVSFGRHRDREAAVLHYGLQLCQGSKEGGRATNGGTPARSSLLVTLPRASELGPLEVVC
jgi:hypothetical protein